MDIIIWVLIMIAALILLLAAWRFFTQRARGTVVILRGLPHSGTHGWRHGSIRYNGEEVSYYKLRSLSPGADLILNRKVTELIGRRKPTPEELDFIPAHVHILEILSAEDRFEVGIGGPGEMALTAWIEAAPDRRRERSSHEELKRNITRRQSRGL